MGVLKNLCLNKVRGHITKWAQEKGCAWVRLGQAERGVFFFNLTYLGQVE